MSEGQIERWYLSLEEVSDSFGVSRELIIEIVNEGILSPEDSEIHQWQFGNEDLCKIRLVLELHRDLGVNWAGAALALELMEEIHRLKSGT